ncbi:MAG: DNA-directed RNA polymerase subunit beta' [Oscillospiraceae bacterium]|jgi:DNA-directed RNA polymerase subunit beta'|nr:DNA-directed RNA polymerase subunit beta' [Oscillospiraceae bacterium]
MACNDFDAIKIGVASPEQILSVSFGEVKKPETINYRTLKPERDGLFCEKIFGPVKDWECSCGKYKRARHGGQICDKCGVEVTESKVRRARMGHVELVVPVSHIWYVKGSSSKIGLILDITPRMLEKVLYFSAYAVIDDGGTPLTEGQVLSEAEYEEMREKYEDEFEAGMGAEAIKKLLQKVDLDLLSEQIKEAMETASNQKRLKLTKRMEVVESFRLSKNRPEWMILDVLPVIPADIRPMVQLDGGRFATSDLNDLYRRVINRNNRLRKLMVLDAPEIIVRNEKRMLQEAVDALIDNGRRGRPITGANNRPLKSLSDMLKGKQGRFRQNLLGKRVDYSGRSVIVVGPELKMYQCGLPKEMALELFKPFVMKRLVELGVAGNVRNARKMVERAKTGVWDALENIIKDHPVLLNRAPTLHRLGIQAFEPVLVEGRAIKLHPLVCSAYNADFDGDQMAVHVPLSVEAEAEARFLMLAANNLLKPSDGNPVVVPTQDMVLGIYYLTQERPGEIGEGNLYKNVDEALIAHSLGYLGLHAKVKIRLFGEVESKQISKIVETTIGRAIFNEAIPQDLGFVDRANPGNMLDFEISFLVNRKKLGDIVGKCIRIHGTIKTAEVLDKLKLLGFKYATRGGMTVAFNDVVPPIEKRLLIEEAETVVKSINDQFKHGLLADEERAFMAIQVWESTIKKVTQVLTGSFDKYNPIFMMVDSGARGNINQLRQLAGMRGLIANTTGTIIDIPIKANYHEGLNVLEYFVSSRGARKGMADMSLRTADSGYLTRRLVDVAQDIIIREEDCGATEGLCVSDVVDYDELIEPLQNRLIGRYLLHDVVNPQTGKLIVPKDILMCEEDAEKIVDAGITKVKIRSVLNCKAKHGICAKCYGINLTSGKQVIIGEAVGVVAAQSIGEPGTQLTMHTFHTGGIADEDITQGLPRVEELFEARKPKHLAIISEIKGRVTIQETNNTKVVRVFDEEACEERKYQIPYGSGLQVKDGSFIEKGDAITEGASDLHDILIIKGELAVQDYLIQEVQKVYRMQGVDINDKHIEVVVRQMLRKLRVLNHGDTNLITGALVERGQVIEENNRINALNAKEGTSLKEATFVPVLLGITKASLATDSFLSAAAFQETTRVLADAAIKGKTDRLVGLKENVIIGKVIPAGTGIFDYNELKIISNQKSWEEKLGERFIESY